MMESSFNTEACFLVTELTQIQELLGQLEGHLDHPSFSQKESCKSLASRIQFSIEKSINMAKSVGFEGKSQALGHVSGSESPLSASGSPISDNSERVIKYQEGREISKKRKTLPKWRNQVTVNSECGVVGPLDDGYSWRKYGQKDILGAKYPRGYYRCTHRNTQSCLATKQVQRTDGNPMVFDVTYHGNHTCHQKPNKPNSNSLVRKQEVDQSPSQSLSHDQRSIQLLQTEVQFKTEERLDSSPIAFTFPSHEFAESNYYSVPPCSISGFEELNELISVTRSNTNSPVPDMDMWLEKIDFDSSFDASSFFS